MAREYEARMVHFPNLILADVTRDVARRAAQVRARFNVHAADALLVATALVHGTSAFVTHDQKLRRLEAFLSIVILDDFAPL